MSKLPPSSDNAMQLPADLSPEYNKIISETLLTLYRNSSSKDFENAFKAGGAIDNLIKNLSNEIEKDKASFELHNKNIANTMNSYQQQDELIDTINSSIKNENKKDQTRITQLENVLTSMQDLTEKVVNKRQDIKLSLDEFRVDVKAPPEVKPNIFRRTQTFFANMFTNKKEKQKNIALKNLNNFVQDTFTHINEIRDQMLGIVNEYQKNYPERFKENNQEIINNVAQNIEVNSPQPRENNPPSMPDNIGRESPPQTPRENNPPPIPDIAGRESPPQTPRENNPPPIPDIAGRESPPQTPRENNPPPIPDIAGRESPPQTPRENNPPPIPDIAGRESPPQTPRENNPPPPQDMPPPPVIGAIKGISDDKLQSAFEAVGGKISKDVIKQVYDAAAKLGLNTKVKANDWGIEENKASQQPVKNTDQPSPDTKGKDEAKVEKEQINNPPETEEKKSSLLEQLNAKKLKSTEEKAPAEQAEKLDLFAEIKKGPALNSTQGKLDQGEFKYMKLEKKAVSNDGLLNALGKVSNAKLDSIGAEYGIDDLVLNKPKEQQLNVLYSAVVSNLPGVVNKLVDKKIEVVTDKTKLDEFDEPIKEEKPLFTKEDLQKVREAVKGLTKKEGIKQGEKEVIKESLKSFKRKAGIESKGMAR